MILFVCDLFCFYSMCVIVRERRREKFVCVCVCAHLCIFQSVCEKEMRETERLGIQCCLVCAVGVADIYTFEAQTTHLCLHYTNYANDSFRPRE